MVASKVELLYHPQLISVKYFELCCGSQHPIDGASIPIGMTWCEVIDGKLFQRWEYNVELAFVRQASKLQFCQFGSELSCEMKLEVALAV